MALAGVCTLAELAASGGVHPVTIGPRELVVVRDGEHVRAVDRRCPHESFPLDLGRVERGAITCPAHGWRFDLRSGSCLTLGHDLRAYDVEVRGEVVLVDADVPATRQELDLAAESLLGALELGRPSLAARRVVRLLALGETLANAAGLLVRYGATHADVGLDVEAAVAADVVALASVIGDAGASAVLADVAAAVAERLARAAPRVPADPATPFAWHEEGVEATLASAVRHGDAEGCESLVAGMLAHGVGVVVVLHGLAPWARGSWGLAVARRAAALDEVTVRVALPVAAFGIAAERARRTGYLPGLAEADVESLLPAAVAFVTAAAAEPLGVVVPGPFDAEIAAALIAGPAETSRGLAVCLAAARAALCSDDVDVRRAVLRFLTTRRRERFVSLRSLPASPPG